MPDLKDVTALLFAWLAIAVVGGVVALAAARIARGVPPFPPQRRRATPWTGPLVGAAFLAFLLVPSLVLPYVDRAALARWLYRVHVDAATAQVVAACAADLVSLPLLLAVWAWLAAFGGKPPALRCDRRRAATGYLSAYRTWLYLTPVAYSYAAVPPRFRLFFMLNPLTAIIEGTRDSFVFNRAPDWALVQVAAVHIDVWARVLRLTPLTGAEWLVVVAGSLLPALIGQADRRLLHDRCR